MKKLVDKVGKVLTDAKVALGLAKPRPPVEHVTPTIRPLTTVAPGKPNIQLLKTHDAPNLPGERGLLVPESPGKPIIQSRDTQRPNSPSIKPLALPDKPVNPSLVSKVAQSPDKPTISPRVTQSPSNPVARSLSQPANPDKPSIKPIAHQAPGHPRTPNTPATQKPSAPVIPPRVNQSPSEPAIQATSHQAPVTHEFMGAPSGPPLFNGNPMRFSNDRHVTFWYHH